MSNFQIIDPPGSTPSFASAAPLLLPLPAPQLPGGDFDVRRGTMEDLPWVDAAQKQERERLGFRFRAELEGHVREGNLWIAESCLNRGPGSQPVNRQDTGWKPVPLGYCIARNRYQHRDELGLIVQMYVAPGSRRSLVAANFLSRIWDQWPSGVKLCSCWCAQDLPANKFWEKCGFRALAFRTGSRETTFTTYDADGNPTGKTKGHRIHIFWQKKIRPRKEDGLTDDTAYWYPKETGGGSLNEARLVFPIPPGSSWRDAKPAILPGVGDLFEALRQEREDAERRALLQLVPPEDASGGPKPSRAEKVAAKQAREAELSAADAMRAAVPKGALRFAPLPPSAEALKAQQDAAAAEAKRAKAEAAKQAKQEAKAAIKKMAGRNDPALAALSRELRDRWLDAVQRDEGFISLPTQDGRAYDVSRQIAAEPQRGGMKRVANVRRLAA